MRYTVNSNDHILTVDVIHDDNEKIYNIDENIKFYLNPKKIKTFKA